jgi:hypothetical protein
MHYAFNQAKDSMIALCTHTCTYTHSLITRISRQIIEIPYKQPDGKGNELTVECKNASGTIICAS